MALSWAIHRNTAVEDDRFERLPVLCGYVTVWCQGRHILGARMPSS